MLKVKIQEKIFYMPENWDEITFRKFQSIQEIELPKEEENYLEYKIDVLAELLGCYIEDLNEVKLSSLGELWSKCEWILNTKPVAELPNLIKLSDGKDYYFDSNLENSSIGQWIDLENLMKDNFWQNAHKIASIFIRPVKKVKYNFNRWKGWKKENYPIKAVDVEDYNPDVADKTADLLLDAPVTIIYTLSVFFWSFSIELLNTILKNSINHIPEQMKKEMMEKIKTVDLQIQHQLLAEDGDGMKSSTPYQMGT